MEACHAIFATDSLGFSPEWFSRIGGELYLAGLNTTMMALPESPTNMKPSDEAVGKMKQCAAEMLGVVEGKPLEVLRESLVWRTPDPLIRCLPNSYVVLPPSFG